MPLYKKIRVNNNTLVLIWKITESFEALQKNIVLTDANHQRVEKMKSDWHRRAFLAVRQLFKKLGYTDNDIVYDNYGKPHTNDGKFISITHSFNFCGVIVSDENPVGIDIEKQRDKIVKIAHKFTPIEEYHHLKNADLIKKLTVVWGAKESLYKIYGKKQLLFKQHIYVDNFKLKDERTTAEIRYNQENRTFFINFMEFEGFTCVYAF